MKSHSEVGFPEFLSISVHIELFGSQNKQVVPGVDPGKRDLKRLRIYKDIPTNNECLDSTRI